MIDDQNEYEDDDYDDDYDDDEEDEDEDDDMVSLGEAICIVEQQLLCDTGHRDSIPGVVRRITGLLAEFRRQLDAIDVEDPNPSTMFQLKALMVQACALRQYAKHLRLGLTTFNLAAELELRTQRKAGMWLSKHLDEDEDEDEDD